jgi:hypothetical protein
VEKVMENNSQLEIKTPKKEELKAEELLLKSQNKFEIV